MSFLQKPTNVYHTDEQNTANSKDSWMNEFENIFKKDLGEKVVEETLKQDKIEVFVEPERVKDPTIDELSYDEKLEFIKKFAKEFNLEFTMKVTPAIKEEPTPVVTPTIEPIKEEVVVEPEPVKEEVKIEIPKQTEKPITFNYERPEGWNKKIKRINFIQVLFNGIFGVDMDPSDFRRYEKFMDNFKPIFFILLIGGVVLAGFLIKVDDNKVNGKKVTVVDRVFNFCVEKYDEWTGRDKKYNNETPKTYNSVDTILKINPNPIYIDTFIKKDTINMSDWEKEYQKLDSTTIK
jgi:hypothetical protein